MKIWLPYVVAGSGSDTFTENLASALASRGQEAVVQRFPHLTQYVPDSLRTVDPPPGCELVLTNTWNGFAFKRPGIPNVTVEHLCVHNPGVADTRSRAQIVFHKWFVRSFERRSFEAADVVVVPSEHTRRAVGDVFGLEEMTVIRQGVDVEYFHPAGPREPSKPFRLLFVGNLTRRKGADLLDPIMEELGSNFVLHYTTGRRQEVELRAPNTYSIGSLDRSGIRDAYQAADVLLCPTRLESGPLVAMEAMACGLPVVGSMMSSMPETVIDGESGLLRSLDHADMAEAVQQVAGDSRLRMQLSTGARRRAVDYFNIEHMVDRYLALFSELVG